MVELNFAIFIRNIQQSHILNFRMLNVIIKKIKECRKSGGCLFRKKRYSRKISSPQVVLRAPVVSNGIKTLLVSDTIKFR